MKKVLAALVLSLLVSPVFAQDNLETRIRDLNCGLLQENVYEITVGETKGYITDYTDSKVFAFYNNNKFYVDNDFNGKFDKIFYRELEDYEICKIAPIIRKIKI